MKHAAWLSGVVGLAIGSCVASLAAAQAEPSAAGRIRSGLEVLYTFGSPSRDRVADRAGSRPAIDLRQVRGSTEKDRGALVVKGDTLLRSDGPASRLIEAVRGSGEITIEAWVKPADDRQAGPARIVTLSKNSSNRNFTLGQDGNKYVVRFRTTKTSANGLPSLDGRARSVAPRKTHLVYTRDRSGVARLYVDGKQQAQRKVVGSTGNWDRSYRLALANELSGDRAWRGTYYLVAIYRRALSPQEVSQNHRAGSGGASAAAFLAHRQGRSAAGLATTLAAKAEHFESRIATLLRRRCIECHKHPNRDGQLDLSRRAAAFAGGESGLVIARGRPADSLLWELVESDDMPQNRPALSASEKADLRAWIEQGAVWTTADIAPVHRPAAIDPAASWVRRLTAPEYIETVRGILGVDIEQDARRILPRDLRADGFNNTAYNLNVDLGHVRAYAELAELIVSRLDVAGHAGRFGRSGDLSPQNLRRIIAGMGRRLYRGPLSDKEVADFLKIAEAARKSGGDFEETVGLVLEAMLQAPRFIYRMEQATGEGPARSLSPYARASRMSYILWGGPPDEALLTAAEEGRLETRADAAAQVRRMLDDPRAVARSAQFISEWLDLERLEYMRPNKKRFPKWNRQLGADMRRETLEFFKEVAWRQKRPLADLFNAQVTFTSPELARHYGLKPPAKAWSRYDLAKERSRGGLLTQGSVLTVGGDEASMVARGLFVLHNVLGGHVDDPPPGTDTTPVPTKAGMSQRGIALERIANKSCGGCHSRFEPLAFGLEKYDGLGSFHERDEHGNRLREDGEIVFPGQNKSVPYKTAQELMDLLAKSEQVKRTLVRKVSQFALGRPLTQADAPALGKIFGESQDRGGTYQAIITAIVLSDLVQKPATAAKLPAAPDRR